MNPQSLRDFLDGLVLDPKYKPSEDGKVTWCNRAVIDTGKLFGCDDFSFPNPTADALYSFIQSNLSGKWSHIDIEFASTQAQAGEWVIAALPSWRLGDSKHGHCLSLYPAPMAYSGSLKQLVPLGANIGKPGQCKIGRVTEFFPVKHGLPKFYLYVRGAIIPYAG